VPALRVVAAYLQAVSKSAGKLTVLYKEGPRRRLGGFIEDSGEAERSFRSEPNGHSGMIPSTMGALRPWHFDFSVSHSPRLVTILLCFMMARPVKKSQLLDGRTLELRVPPDQDIHGYRRRFAVAFANPFHENS